MTTHTAEEPHAGSPDSGTYEVLRDRLGAQASELARRAEELNTRRIETFGSMELRLTGTEHLRTESNSMPRDVVAVGDRLLLGHNVSPGLRARTTVGDVFAVHDRELNRLAEDAVPGLLDDPDFRGEFEALHRYYQGARLLRLRRVDGRLLAVFRTGDKADDIRVLRWELTPDGAARFLDARGERDHVLPPSHDFEWTAATRDDHVLGRHPHVSVGGEVFVSTVGGFLTVKTEDDTETAEGIHAEPVVEPLQSLGDAGIEHARVGPLVLLRIRPYKEEAYRHLVHNTVTGTVVRLDGIGQACRRLPEDQGIVFPGGYYLTASGTARTFDIDAGLIGALEFERTVRSPNGEDVMFVFHARVEGRSLLLPYNVIRKSVATPLLCRGYALFEDGTLLVLRADGEEPGRVHPAQRWQSPFVSDTYAAARPAGEGPLAVVGNADLVRGISDCLSLAGAVTETQDSPTTGAYEALLAACARAMDAYHWLADPELGDLGSPLAGVRATAEQIVTEYETVRELDGTGLPRAGRGGCADRGTGTPAAGRDAARRGRVGRGADRAAPRTGRADHAQGAAVRRRRPYRRSRRRHRRRYRLLRAAGRGIPRARGRLRGVPRRDRAADGGGGGDPDRRGGRTGRRAARRAGGRAAYGHRGGRRPGHR